MRNQIKSNQIKSNSIILLFSLLFCGILLTLTSCENFLNGKQVKDEILDAIAYNNAKEITVLVQAQEGSGSTVPAGNYVAKKGYDFDLSFTEAAGYSFIKWIAVDKDDPKTIITDGVVFENEKSPKTKVKITIDSIPLRLIPLCTDRIAVYGEPTPRYDSAGVGRDRSIEVDFTKELSPKSFIFESSELPQGAVPKTDSNGSIWAYTYESQTYFKNISIVSSEGLSLAQHFNKPQVSGKNLIIPADKDNPIPFGTGEISKIVVVTISKNINDKDGVSAATEKTWRYLILEASDDKATINFSAVSTEGSINAVSKAYSVGQTIGLTFTENADYQFIKWEYDSSIVRISEPQNPDTKVIVREKTTETNPTQIKAICAQRLRVLEDGFSPAGGTSNAVSKNSSIQIIFNHNLPQNENGLAQLENISITIGGIPVKSSFLPPDITGGTVTFNADPYNMLAVPAGQTKTVTVSIPADFYYELEDDNHTRVYYGGNGKSFNYKIDDTTNEKALISFVQNNTESGSYSKKGKKDEEGYSIGEQIDIAYVLNDDYKFNGWKILDAQNNELVPDENGFAAVTIEEPKSLSTKLNVNAQVQGIKVVADTSMKLFVSSFSPTGNNNNRDSQIEITFSKPLDQNCATAAFLNQIKVKLDDLQIDSYFEDRSVNQNKIILKNTKYLDVKENEKKTVSVIIPSSFYYIDRELTVYLEKDFNFEYEVTSETFVELPAVISHTPAATQAVTADTPVKIYFNMAMDAVEPASQVFAKDNISLTYRGQTLSDYFEEPVYDSQNKTLILQPICVDKPQENKTSLASYIKKTLNLSSIDLLLSLENISVGELPVVQNSNSNFIVRYFGETEKNSPEEVEFFVTREEITLASHAPQNKFNYDSLKNFDDDKIHQNATKGIIYIYGNYKDTESGVKTVLITEEYKNDTAGIPLENDPLDPVSFNVLDNKNMFYSDSAGYTSFCIPYELQSEDGVIFITVDIEDACGNSAEQHTFTAIKKSLLTLDGVQLTNLRPNKKSLDEELKENMQYYEDNIKNIKIERLLKNLPHGENKPNYTSNFYNTIYADTYFNSGDYTFTCEYEGKEGTFSFAGENEDIKEQYWNYTLETESLDGLKVKVCVCDFLGNQTERIYIFPKEAIPYYSEEKPNYKYLFFTTSEDIDYALDIVTRSSTTNFNWLWQDSAHRISYYSSPTGVLESGQIMQHSSNGLWGQLSKVYTEADYNKYLGTNNTTNVIDLLKAPVVQKSELDGYVDIKVNINKNLWKSAQNPEGFEEIMIQVCNSRGEYLQTCYFEHNTTSLTIHRLLRAMTSQNTNSVKIFGFTGESVKQGSKEYIINDLQLLSLDNMGPSIGISGFATGTKTDKQFYCFSVSDYNTGKSGIESIEVIINGVKIEPIIDNDRYYISVWDMLEKETNILIINAEDKANNVSTKKVIIKMDILDDIIRFNRKGSYWEFNSHEYKVQKYQIFDPAKSDWTLWNKDDQTLAYSCYKYYLPENSTFLKVQRFNSEGTASTIPVFYYTGTEQNTGIYDLVLPNGNAKDSVAIQSDAPVLVQTLITPVSYNECKDWSTDQWDFYKKPVDEKIMTFSNDTVDAEDNVIIGDHNPKRYSIDLEKVPLGYCYTVVAHFANGTTAQSQVWQR